MDHIVSYKTGSCVKDMEYYKSTTEKTSDLRRWRERRKEVEGVIIFFADGTIFDTFLQVYNGMSFPVVHNYWRHYYRLQKQPTLCIDTLLAYYKTKFEQWAKIIIENNGINSL